MSVVSVILGSDSDREIAQSVLATLKDFGILFEKRIISAHRAPDFLRDYIRNAEKRGIKVFIAMAGMAAALPGVIASYTTLPVIGVPVALKSTAMGLDSLLSIVQMPPGIPVATVALNGGKNAALLAAEILALSDRTIAQLLKKNRKGQRDEIVQKDRVFRDE